MEDLTKLQRAIDSGYEVGFTFGVQNEYDLRMNGPIGNAMSWSDIWLVKAMANSPSKQQVDNIRKKEAEIKEYKQKVENDINSLRRLLCINELKNSLWVIEYFNKNVNYEFKLREYSDSFGLLTINLIFDVHKEYDINSFYKVKILPILEKVKNTKMFTFSITYSKSNGSETYYYTNDPYSVILRDESSTYVQDNFLTYIK